MKDPVHASHAPDSPLPAHRRFVRLKADKMDALVEVSGRESEDYCLAREGGEPLSAKAPTVRVCCANRRA